MNAAKNAVKDFLSKNDHHDTTVHQHEAPAVVQDTHNKQHEERVTTAVMKERHVDHHHTTVQPVFDKEVLPEQHHHNLAAVEKREHHHGNERETAERLKQEAAQFQDTRVQGETRHTQSINPVVQGEQVHHHVHETIQPVIQKETIEPHVTHTTVPIHEVHHEAPKHHATTALPAVSIDEFKKAGGVLTGREERQNHFEGCPPNAHSHEGGLGQTHESGLGHSHTGTTTGTGHHHTGAGATAAAAAAGTAAAASHGSEHESTKKPGLLAKLNPRRDADGDGKAGFMD